MVALSMITDSGYFIARPGQSLKVYFKYKNRNIQLLIQCITLINCLEPRHYINKIVQFHESPGLSKTESRIDQDRIMCFLIIFLVCNHLFLNLIIFFQPMGLLDTARKNEVCFHIFRFFVTILVLNSQPTGLPDTTIKMRSPMNHMDTAAVFVGWDVRLATQSGNSRARYFCIPAFDCIANFFSRSIPV